MKILAIGDIHGKEIWQQAVSTIAADKIVLVGDYVNAKRWIFNQKFRSNLEALIAFKRNNFDHVHLLLGNHDLPYLRPSIFPASGLRRILSTKLYRLYRDNERLFEAAYQYNQYLFTHAGVSRLWYERHRPLFDGQPGDTIAEKINALHRSGNFKALHEKGRTRGGSFPYGGITYADKTETENNALDGYIQIVGHTKVKKPVLSKLERGSVIYIDCLNTTNEFLYIHEHKILATKIGGGQRDLTAT